MENLRKKFEDELLKILLAEDENYLYNQDEVINILTRVLDEVIAPIKFQKEPKPNTMLHKVIDDIGNGMYSTAIISPLSTRKL